MPLPRKLQLQVVDGDVTLALAVAAAPSTDASYAEHHEVPVKAECTVVRSALYSRMLMFSVSWRQAGWSGSAVCLQSAMLHSSCDTQTL